MFIVLYDADRIIINTFLLKLEIRLTRKVKKKHFSVKHDQNFRCSKFTVKEKCQKNENDVLYANANDASVPLKHPSDQ